MRFALVMASIETLADFFLKRYVQTDETGYLLGGIGGYGSVVYIFQRALRNEKLGRVNGAWNAFTTISDVFVGMFTGESYSVNQILGFILIACGIVLI